MKNYIEQNIIFRLIDSHWCCLDPKITDKPLCQFLQDEYGVYNLPDHIEFMRLNFPDKSVYINVSAMRVAIRIVKPKN